MAMKVKEKNPGVGIWTITQVVVVVYIIGAIMTMIATPTSSTFGVALFFLLLWTVILFVGLFIFFILNGIFFKDSDLFHGLYVGVSLMAGLNIFVEAIILIGENIIMREVESAGFARVMYVLLSIVCIVLAIFEFIYVKFALYSKKD